MFSCAFGKNAFKLNWKHTVHLDYDYRTKVVDC